MLPIPTHSGFVAIVSLSALALLGVTINEATTVATAFGGFVLVVGAYAGTFPLARRSRRERLEFAWWPSQGARGPGSVHVPGAPIQVRCFLRHHGARAIRLTDFAMVAPEGLTVLRGLEGPLRAPAYSRSDFDVELSACAVGRWIAQGMAARIEGPFGLFTMPLYFPHPLSVSVLPRAARALRGAPPRAGAGARVGRASLRKRGTGTELRELRELQPGDPFKSIAWKTSARLGKLVVREVEQEVQEMHLLLLDVSPSMRGGPLGSRKLDQAFDFVASLGFERLSSGDRVAAATFDRRVVGQLGPGDGRRQMLELFDLLLAATEITDDDLTEADDMTVAALVSRYLRHQTGTDFSPHEASPGLLSKALRAHLHAAVGTDLGRVQARDHAARLLRRYCQQAGLGLAYHTHTSGHEKTAALVQALSSGHRPGAPASHITVVTDGDGLLLDEPLRRTLSRLRARGHRVSFVLLRTGEVPEETECALGRELSAVFRAREARYIDTLARTLGGLGVRAMPLGGIGAQARAARDAEVAA